MMKMLINDLIVLMQMTEFLGFICDVAKQFCLTEHSDDDDVFSEIDKSKLNEVQATLLDSVSDSECRYRRKLDTPVLFEEYFAFPTIYCVYRVTSLCINVGVSYADIIQYTNGKFSQQQTDAMVQHIELNRKFLP